MQYGSLMKYALALSLLGDCSIRGAQNDERLLDSAREAARIGRLDEAGDRFEQAVRNGLGAEDGRWIRYRAWEEWIAFCKNRKVDRKGIDRVLFEAKERWERNQGYTEAVDYVILLSSSGDHPAVAVTFESAMNKLGNEELMRLYPLCEKSIIESGRFALGAAGITKIGAQKLMKMQRALDERSDADAPTGGLIRKAHLLSMLYVLARAGNDEAKNIYASESGKQENEDIGESLRMALAGRLPKEVAVVLLQREEG